MPEEWYLSLGICTDTVFSELCTISRLSLGMTHGYLSLPYSGLVLKYYQCSMSLHNVQTVDRSLYSITLTDFKFVVMGSELVI